MNNKGFAITGIIYTLFILFLMILLSVLSGLSISKNMMSSSIEAFEDSLSGTKLDDAKVAEINASGIAPYFGKYLFKVNITKDDGTVDYNVTCSTYLKKGTDFINEADSITLSPQDCNEYDIKTNMQFEEIYSFEN